MLSKKDILEINKAFHTGKLSNESSLNFALDHTYRSKNWIKTSAILARSIICDHVFEDGNKRTAAGVIATIMDLHSIPYIPERLDAAVIAIAKKNLKAITTIEKVILHARK